MKDEIIRKLREHDKRFEAIDKRFDEHDKRFDKLTNAVLTNSRDIKEIKETMATKKDINKITDTLDELVGFAKKKDQEMSFMSQRLTRVEKDVIKIKPLVGLKTS
ncbi:MAG: hypothetical protein ABH835_03225 [Patescibacteria group bacterium]|nr:hypothetical protein [Patescibacteria group bacterium]